MCSLVLGPSPVYADFVYSVCILGYFWPGLVKPLLFTSPSPFGVLNSWCLLPYSGIGSFQLWDMALRFSLMFPCLVFCKRHAVVLSGVDDVVSPFCSFSSYFPYECVVPIEPGSIRSLFLHPFCFLLAIFKSVLLHKYLLSYIQDTMLQRS